MTNHTKNTRLTIEDTNLNHDCLYVNMDYIQKGLSCLDILIIAQIHDFQDDGLCCCITDERLAALFGERVTKVKKSIAKLESLNIIRCTMATEDDTVDNRQRRILTVNDETAWNLSA